jgi:hypothetical protein
VLDDVIIGLMLRLRFKITVTGTIRLRLIKL